MKKPFQLYLDQHDRSLLKGLARRQGLSMAETVREAVRRWAVDEVGSHDPVLGLIGGFDAPEVPADLSTRHDEYAAAGCPTRRVVEPHAEECD